MFLEKENYNARYYSGCDSDSDASGHVAHVASQQKLGLWPERRTWIDCSNPVDPAAHGTPPFLITNAEKEI
jgi:hypothetical protein